MKRIKICDRQYIDKGQYGNVYYEPKRRCAIKTMNVSEKHPQTVGISGNSFIEWNAMSILKCRRAAKDDVEILNLDQATISLNLNKLSLWMPFCQEGNLMITLQRLRDQKDLKSYLKGLIKGFGCVRSLIRGLSNLEQIGMIHRDIKPTNLIVDGQSGILIDLGIATNLHADPGEMWASPTALAYKAPELLTGNTLTYAHEIDIWSVGVMIYHIMSLDEFKFHNHDEQFDDQEVEAANIIADRLSLNNKTFERYFEDFPRYARRCNHYANKLKHLRKDFEIPQIVFDILSICLIMDPEERRKTTYERLEVMIDNLLVLLNDLYDK